MQSNNFGNHPSLSNLTHNTHTYMEIGVIHIGEHGKSKVRVVKHRVFMTYIMQYVITYIWTGLQRELTSLPCHSRGGSGFEVLHLQD